MLRRREFIQTGLAAGAVLALGPTFWREALADTPAQPGPGPYGPLGPVDANGLSLPPGFRSRLVARGGEPVPGTAYPFHIFPDGQATYATPDGGWILVSNSEAPAPAGGGASAIRFRADGGIASAYRILGGTNLNCAGGATPWGTWMSCEEVDSGQVFECDPTGTRPAVARPAMGVFKHEAVAVDPEGRRIYLSEDQGDGGFYRFTPDRYPDASRGTLEIAVVGAGGRVTWKRVPNPTPSPAQTPTRDQVPGATEFKRGEGIWFDSGIVYLATTSDNKIHAYDTATARIEVLYDAGAIPDPPLTGVDNVTVSRSGDLFVCEDNGSGELDIGILTPERQVARFLRATGPRHENSELAGVIFNPAGDRMYLSSQRAQSTPGPGGPGEVYEVSGPFRTARPDPPARQTPGQPEAVAAGPGLRITAPRRYDLDRFRRAGLPVEVEMSAARLVTLTLTAQLPNRYARRGRPARRHTLARVARDTGGRSDLRLRLRPSPAVAAKLRGRRSVAARLTVVAEGSGGTRTTRSRAIRLNAAQLGHLTG